MLGTDRYLRVQVDAGDALEVERLTLALRRELAQLDVGRVEIERTARLPPGAKAVEPAAVEGLVVTITQGAALMSIVGALRAWLSRDIGRRAKVELAGDVLELSGISADEHRRLIDQWIERHSS